MKGPSYVSLMTSHERIPTSEFTHRVARDGVSSHRQELADLGAQALAIGVRPGAAAVLLDPGSPDVAAERAYAVVARALGRRRSETTPRFVVVA